MSTLGLVALLAGIAVLVYASLVALLYAAGRRDDAVAAARFIPDCLVLFRRLLADPRVPRRRKLVLAAALAYLAIPFDLVPDFIPVAGQLDDAIVVVLALRHVLGGAGLELLAEHWPGPAGSRDLVARLVLSARDGRA